MPKSSTALKRIRRLTRSLRGLFCALTDPEARALLLLRALQRAASAREALHLWKIRLDHRVAIAKGTRVHATATVEVRGGGSVRIGENCSIEDYACILTYGGRIEIGARCSINPFTVIYGHGGVVIGNDVLVAGHCMIIPSNHCFAERSRPIREQGAKSRGIVIEDDVWLAHSCSVLDGVTIGRGSVVGAGAVVTRSVAPYSVVCGVPARPVARRK